MRLRREPALFYISLLAPSVQALVAFLVVNDPTLAGLINAAAAAVAGALVAFLVKADNLVPAITGAAQAVLAMVVGLGLDWSPEQQALLLVPVGLVAGYVVRDRVVAPVPAPVVHA